MSYDVLVRRVANWPLCVAPVFQDFFDTLPSLEGNFSLFRLGAVGRIRATRISEGQARTRKNDLSQLWRTRMAENLLTKINCHVQLINCIASSGWPPRGARMKDLTPLLVACWATLRQIDAGSLA